MPRVQRQKVLKNQYQVDDRAHEGIRHQHMKRVGLPVHRLGAGARANQPVEKVVNWIKNRIQEGPLIGYHWNLGGSNCGVGAALA